ncbi:MULTISPECIES: hypothetical protein [unclassified Streptococcus]|uniref:hypothetical protein n=1 Tax=unclassified Streptococcus TaxID=2608887 RepID=UPI001647FA53|nr:MULTISPECIES: hypothetical protein [unclassified Streptococcus]
MTKTRFSDDFSTPKQTGPIKSRRQAQLQRKKFQSKLNLILMIALILLGLLIYAILKW